MRKSKNPCAKNSKISLSKFRQLVKCFAVDIDATRASIMVGISRVTANRYYMAFRQAILCHLRLPVFTDGDVELDESYFGSRHHRGKRGRGAQGKQIVFGCLNRGGNVFAGVVPDVRRATLFEVIEKIIDRAVVIHTDCYRSYNALLKKGYLHFRVNHSADEFANSESHINTIESFWSYCKRRFAKFNGVRNRFFSLHLCECEWRFNFRKSGWKAISDDLMKLLRKYPLFSELGTLSIETSALSRVSACEGSNVLKLVNRPVALLNKFLYIPKRLGYSKFFDGSYSDLSDLSSGIFANRFSFLSSLCFP